jgi:protein involved in polysaccharide export with SLBB domain
MKQWLRVCLYSLALCVAILLTTVPTGYAQTKENGTSTAAAATDAGAAKHEDAPAEMATDEGYTLGPGDKIRLTIFGEEDLSGEFEVDGTGIVSLPLIGNMKAGGLTLRTLENQITDKFKDGYLVNPRVSIQVLNFRPFFILGEVNSPGSYPYVNGLTVLNAVAVAGGYTHRARTDRVMIKRGKKSDEFEATDDQKVVPGDIIRVTERFF